VRVSVVTKSYRPRFVLSLDNFRTAVILGPLRFRWRHALQIAAVFGFFDGVAPLVGF